LIAVKEKLKSEFLEWLWRRACCGPIGPKKCALTRSPFGHGASPATNGWTFWNAFSTTRSGARRSWTPGVVLVVGGRIYQRDNVSEKMVYGLVEFLNRDEELGERVIFLHNYNVWEAPRLFHGTDGSVMLSDDGREASATGFMKAQMNGGAVIANPDGAVPEFVFLREPFHLAGKPNGYRGQLFQRPTRRGLLFESIERF
jgi:hypothetical protein